MIIPYVLRHRYTLGVFRRKIEFRFFRPVDSCGSPGFSRTLASLASLYGVHGRSCGNTRRVPSLYAEGPKTVREESCPPYPEGPRVLQVFLWILWIGLDHSMMACTRRVRIRFASGALCSRSEFGRTRKVRMGRKKTYLQRTRKVPNLGREAERPDLPIRCPGNVEYVRGRSVLFEAGAVCLPSSGRRLYAEGPL